MIPHGNGKPESRQGDPEQMMKLLEIELAQKKTEWAATQDHYRTVRTLAFFFLALIIMGAGAVFFIFVLPKLSEMREQGAPAASATPSH